MTATEPGIAFEVPVPYLHIHDPVADLLLFGHILSHVLSGLENSTEFGKWVIAPLPESMPSLECAEILGTVSVPWPHLKCQAVF